MSNAASKSFKIMTTNSAATMIVLAGGYDLEMLTIINIARKCGIEVSDKFLGWGQSSSVHAEVVAQALEKGREVVFIEPIFSEEYPQPEGVIVIDHHGEAAGRPASILQFLSLMGMQPTREQELIAANDCGYIPAMMAMGATAVEIAAIRRLDREAQGITEVQEQQAIAALETAEETNGLTIVRLPHSKCATVCDRLFNPEKGQNLLIVCEDGEVDYYGGINLRLALNETFGGFYGGNPEGDGFWGCGNTDKNWQLLPNWKELQETQENFVLDFFA